MKVGQAIRNLMKNEALTGEQMAMDLHVDPSLISRFKTGDRNMSIELAKESVKNYPNAFYNMEMTREFSDRQTAPRLDGRAIESSNRLAVIITAKKEAEEALESLDLNKFLKAPENADDNDLRIAELAFKECKEAEWAFSNLCATIQETYLLPGKKISDELTRKWKATEYITKETL